MQSEFESAYTQAYNTQDKENVSIYSIYERMTKDHTLVLPKLQRDPGTWDESKQIAYIESIIKNMTPTPIIQNTVNESRFHQYDEMKTFDGSDLVVRYSYNRVIDGGHRLTAILDYFTNKFKVHDVYYKELSDKNKTVFQERKMTFHTFRDLNLDEEAHLFDQINQNKPLSTGERFNAKVNNGFVSLAKYTLYAYPSAFGKDGNGTGAFHFTASDLRNNVQILVAGMCVANALYAQKMQNDTNPCNIGLITVSEVPTSDGKLNTFMKDCAYIQDTLENRECVHEHMQFIMDVISDINIKIKYNRSIQNALCIASNYHRAYKQKLDFEKYILSVKTYITDASTKCKTKKDGCECCKCMWTHPNIKTVQNGSCTSVELNRWECVYMKKYLPK